MSQAKSSRRVFYAAQDFAVVRMCTLAHDESRKSWVDIDPDNPDEKPKIIAYLKSLRKDLLFREALDIGSEALARLLDRIDSGDIVSSAQLRRAIFAITKYHLRMSTRPTPFGIMAGVGLVSTNAFNGHGRAHVGNRHTRGVRPDLGWLAEIIRERKLDKETILNSAFQRNNLCFERGDKLVLPVVFRERDLAKTEVTVRLTPFVRRLMSITSKPSHFTEIAHTLFAEYPGLSRERLVDIIRRLIDEEILLCELDLATNGRVDIPALTPKICAESHACVSQIVKLDSRIQRYRRSPLGRGSSLLGMLREQARMIRDGKNVVQVDLRSDVDIDLPKIVSTELEQAATTLHRIDCTPEPAYISDYRIAFLERYGHQALVPVKTLLNSELGLDAPVTYLQPRTRRHATTEAENLERSQAVAHWAQEAFLTGQQEIALDERRVEMLSQWGPPHGPKPLEMSFHLMADSIAEIERGNFTAALSVLSGSRPILGTFGRFMYMFDSETLLNTFAHADSGRAGVLEAHLAHGLTTSRMANVSSHPILHENTIQVGTFFDPEDPHAIELDDIAVGATDERLYVVSMSRGVEINPITLSMLNGMKGLDNFSRFLREVGSYGNRTGFRWRWGILEQTLSHLPRVRYGRTILARARWRLPDNLFDRHITPSEWDSRLKNWQEKWRLDDRVLMVTDDHWIELNLSYILHRGLLRNEMRRTSNISIQEQFAESSQQWLNGHVSEITLPLIPTSADVTPPVNISNLRVINEVPTHRPGSEWLHLKLYAAERRLADLLTNPLKRFLQLLPADVDKWFFIRYRDPDAHLRIRLHAPVDVVNHVLLPLVHTYIGDMCRAGEARKYVLDEYRPEIARYGDGEALTLAETVFAADSEVTIALLDQNDQEPSRDALSHACLSIADVIRGLVGEGWRDWICRVFVRRTAHESYREKAALVDLVDEKDEGSFLVPHSGARLTRLLHDRELALRSYAEHLKKEEFAHSTYNYDNALKSVLHMHHNRLYGIDADHERRAYDLLRSAVEAAERRKRYQA